MKCPNCNEEVEDLFGNEFGVVHCGCFYESSPDKVTWHFSNNEFSLETEEQEKLTAFKNRLKWILSDIQINDQNITKTNGSVVIEGLVWNSHFKVIFDLLN